MRITIFPKANPHPKSREEKQNQGKYTSSPYKGEVISITDESHLVQVICSNAWSPSVFREFRRNDDFISTDFIVLDIDDTLRMEDAEKRCDSFKFCYLILPSPSYTEQLHKYRIVIPLVEPILNKEMFNATLNWFLEQFPEADQKCKDYARFYFGCTYSELGIWADGELFKPIKPKFTEVELKEFASSMVPVEGYEDLTLLERLYGEVPKHIPTKVDHFLKNAHTGLEGHWTLSLNDFAFTLGLQGIADEVIERVVEELAPNELDKTDRRTLSYALRDARVYAEV
jgi:hypothetical protein